jgi:hypothetical protein
MRKENIFNPNSPWDKQSACVALIAFQNSNFRCPKFNGLD